MVAPFQSKERERPALHGVHIVPHPDGGAVLVATELLPTPIANDALKRGNFDPDRSVCLPGELRRHALPTPKATDVERGGRGDLLTVLRGYETRHAATLPTPTARDWLSGKTTVATQTKNSRPLNEVLTTMAGATDGRVNPRFVEWMMGYPFGWTELPPSGTP